MTLPQLSKALTSIYNKLGNEWIKENFESEPFDFRVYVRRGDDDDLQDIIAEVYTDRPFPESLTYKQNVKKNFRVDGVHNSVVINKFKELANYIETFGALGRTFGVVLMDLEMKKINKTPN